jgi:hypothetical protein
VTSAKSGSRGERRAALPGSLSMQPSVFAIAPMRWPRALPRYAVWPTPRSRCNQSLDEAQKRRFAIAMRFAARRHMAEHRRHG